MIKISKNGILVIEVSMGVEAFVKPPNKLMAGSAEMLTQAGYILSLVDDVLHISYEGQALLTGEYPDLNDDEMEAYLEVLESGFEGPTQYAGFLTQEDRERELYNDKQPEYGTLDLHVNGVKVNIQSRNDLIKFVTAANKYQELTGKCVTHLPLNSFVPEDVLYTPQEYARLNSSLHSLFSKYMTLSNRLSCEQAKSLSQLLQLDNNVSTFEINNQIFLSWGFPFIKGKILYKSMTNRPGLHLSKRILTDGYTSCIGIKDNTTGIVYTMNGSSEDTNSVSTTKQFSSAFCQVPLPSVERVIYSIKASNEEAKLTVDVELDEFGIVIGNNFSQLAYKDAYTRLSITGMKLPINASDKESEAKLKIFSILRDKDIANRSKLKTDFITFGLKAGASLADIVKYMFYELEDSENAKFKDTLLASTVSASISSIPYDAIADYFDASSEYSELSDILREKPETIDLYDIYMALNELEESNALDDVTDQGGSAMLNLDPVTNLSAALKILYSDIKLDNQYNGYNSDNALSVSFQELTNCIYITLMNLNSAVLNMDIQDLQQYIEDNFSLPVAEVVKQSEMLGLLYDCVAFEKLRVSANSLFYVLRTYGDFGKNNVNDIAVEYLKLNVFKGSAVDKYINDETKRLEKSIRVNIENNSERPKHLASFYRLMYPQAILENIWRAYFNKTSIEILPNFNYVKEVTVDGTPIKMTIQMSKEQYLEIVDSMRTLVTREISLVNDLYCYNFRSADFDFYMVNANLEPDKVTPKNGYEISRIPAGLAYYDTTVLNALIPSFGKTEEDLKYINDLKAFYTSLRMATPFSKRKDFSASSMATIPIAEVAEVKKLMPELSELELYRQVVENNDLPNVDCSVIARQIKATLYLKHDNPENKKLSYMRSKFQKNQRPICKYIKKRNSNYNFYEKEVVYSSEPASENRLRNLLGEVEVKQLAGNSQVPLLEVNKNYRIVNGYESGLLSSFYGKVDDLHEGLTTKVHPKIVDENYIDGININKLLTAEEAVILMHKYNGIWVGDTVALVLNYSNKIIMIKAVENDAY